MRKRKTPEATSTQPPSWADSAAAQPVPTAPPGYVMVPATPHKRGLRKMSWFILVVNALFLAWVIAGAVSGSHASDCGTLSKQACQAAADVGTGIGVGIIVVIWVVVDFFLLVIWLVTRPRQR